MIESRFDKALFKDIISTMYQGINTAADKVIYAEQGMPIIQSKHFTSGKLTLADTKFIGVEDVQKYGHKYIPEIGDILFSNIGTVGKSVVVDVNIDFMFAWNVFLIKLKTEKVFNLYLQYYLDYLLKRNAYEPWFTGGTVKFLNKKTIGNFNIPLPHLPEQQKIASILDAADSLRQKDQQLIEKYTALSQSLFLEMFGDPETNPMGWTKSIAEKFIDLLTGFAFKSTDYSINKDDINLCGGLIITPTGIEWNKSNYWRRDKCDGLEKYKIIESDIVMAMDRPWISSGFKIHKITKNDKESLLVQRTARIRGRGINQDFLYFLFKHKAFEKQAHTTETTVPHISPKDIRKYELIIPPITLQNQFAERIQYIEAQKQIAQASLEKSEALFNSLLQRAFKGELTV